MKRKRFLLVMLLASATALMLMVAGPASPAPVEQEPGASADASCAKDPADAAAYTLQVGDVLGIDFRFTPEFNASPAIRPDGHVAMSGVGDVAAADRTVRQLTCALEDAYRAFLRDPVISVSVQNFENPSFIVSGDVERHGKYDLRSQTTVTEAIAIAGGFRRSARQSGVYLFRRGAGGEMAAHVVDVKGMLEKGQLARDVALQKDDMLFVPQSGFSRIERFIPIPGIGWFLSVP